MPLMCTGTDRSRCALSIDVPHLGVFRASSPSKPARCARKGQTQPKRACGRPAPNLRPPACPRAQLAREHPSYDQTMAWFDQTIVWFHILCAPAPPPSTEHISELNYRMVWTCPRPPHTRRYTTGHHWTHTSPSSPIIHAHLAICSSSPRIYAAFLHSSLSFPYSSYTGSRHWKCHF